jgi:DNA repair exonuclease SbcCD ATPase subunit
VEESAERAKTTATTIKATARDAAEAAAREKAALETKMSELESDLRMATIDLATTSCQFSQVTNQLQVATEEVPRLQDSNAKLLQDLDGTQDDPPALDWFGVCFMSELDSLFLVAGVHLIHTGMVVQLATVKQEQNAAIRKVIEKEDALRRLSEQLQKVHAEMEQVQASREQDTTALSYTRNALRKSEAISGKAIGDLAKLGRTLSSTMVAFGVSFGPWTPETLIEEVGRLPSVVWELELSTARHVVHRILAMIESHCQGLDHTALSGSWALGIPGDQCDELEQDCAAFAREMADAALKDPELLPQDEPEAPKVPGPPN